MAEDAQEGARKSDRTRLTILGAARIAFARKGFSGVTIRDITDLACVTRASFYYYFRDKTELFIELGTATYREAMLVVETLGEDGTAPSRESIEEWVGQYFKYLDRNGAFVIRSEEDMPQDATFRAAVARSHRRAATVLGQRINKIAVTAPTVEAMLHRARRDGAARAVVVDGAASQRFDDAPPSGARRHVRGHLADGGLRCARLSGWVKGLRSWAPLSCIQNPPG